MLGNSGLTTKIAPPNKEVQSTGGGGPGGGTPIYGLYEDVPLNRVWFLPL